jgi:phosphatidylglycerol lysyltransferase
MAIGNLFHKRPVKRTHTVPVELTPSHSLRRSVRFIAACLTIAVGVVNMLSSIVPRVNWDMFIGSWSIGSYHGMHRLLIVNGFFLLMLSYGLMRGKRQAWYAVLLLLIVSLLLRVLSHGTVLMTLLTIAFVALLLALAGNFRARSDPPSVRRGQIALLVGLSIVTAYAVGGFVILYRDFELLIDRIGIETVILLILSDAHTMSVYNTRVLFLERVLPLLCISAIVYGIGSILRPVTATFLPDEQEHQTAADLAHQYGTNSISYFALETGKSHFFSASRSCVVSYVLQGNVAVVAGDPIGPAEEMCAAVRQFTAFCQEQDWTMVFWQAREAFTDIYRRAGLHILKIGEDAVIDTHAFTLSGKAMANVRSSAKRAEKEGLHVVFYRGQVENAEHLAQLERISQQWLARKGGAEKGFSMGRFDPHGDPEQVTAVAVSDAQIVQAFVTFVPIYGRNGWGLDLMRRSEEAAPGTMELLLVRSIEYLRKQGADMVSLGLAPMSNATQRDANLLYTSIDFLGRLFGNPERGQALFNFKKKFQPVWEERYLVFSSTLTLPKVGWALYNAHQYRAPQIKRLKRMLSEQLERQQAARREMAQV